MPTKRSFLEEALEMDFPAAVVEIFEASFILGDEDCFGDWRDYVPLIVRRYWEHVSFESRLLVYALAKDSAAK